MKELIVKILEKVLNTKLKKEEIETLVEIPPQQEMGDFAFPCFSLAKIEKKSPLLIAEELAEKIRKNLTKEISGVEVKSAYVNFFVDKKVLTEKVLKEAVKKDYGRAKKDIKKRKVFIDYSHPNVAKHFGIHNLRSTLIGHAIYNILKFYNQKVISVNHLGDWGTQFGKLIVAYKRWGKGKVNSIDELNKLYVKFHEEVDSGYLGLEDEARSEFKKLEDGDKEDLKLWKTFYDISMKEFEEVYKIFNIKFDEIKGESYYKEDIKKVEALLKKYNLLEESEGAQVVKIREGIPPLIVKKSDEASTYASRDLAAIMERMAEKPDQILYVVDVAQSLHFEQVFDVAGRVGFPKEKMLHLKFGRLKFKDFQMSTRKGQVILFEDLLGKSEEKILKNIEAKNPELKNKEEVARKVAVAGIIFNDLKQDKKLDIVFDWDEAMASEGRTGPYLLYSYARASSIVRKVKKSKEKMKIFDLSPQESALVKKIADFPDLVLKAYEQLSPNLIANYSYELAQIFNEFYHVHQVIGSKEEIFRLELIEAFRNTLNNSLKLLGIDTLEEM